MIYLYQAIFYRPILNALVYFYETVAGRDFGIAIILTTLLIRLVLYPLFHKGAKHQMALQRLQPKIKKLQELHKDDKQKQTEALMALYKEHGVNPFLSFILLIVQLPILISLYRIILSGLGATGIGSGLYSFIPAPQTINAIFIHLINLKQHSIILVLLAAIAQYFQARLADAEAERRGGRGANGGRHQDGSERQSYRRRNSASPRPQPPPPPRSTIPARRRFSSPRATIPMRRSPPARLRAAKHVFCEKPLALDRASLADAIESRARLGPDAHRRLQPPLRASAQTGEGGRCNRAPGR